MEGMSVMMNDCRPLVLLLLLLLLLLRWSFHLLPFRKTPPPRCHCRYRFARCAADNQIIRQLLARRELSFDRNININRDAQSNWQDAETPSKMA